MDLEQPKPNQVKQKIALTSTIALLSASVGVSHHVKADDLASEGAQASNTSEESLPKPETFEEAKATVEAVETNLNQQKAELAQVDASLADKEKEVEQLQAQKTEQEAALTKAQTVYTETIASNEENLLAEAQAYQDQLIATEAELAEIQTGQEAEAAALASQKAIIASQSEQAKNLTKQVVDSEQEVAKFNDMISKPQAISAAAQAASDGTQKVVAELEKAKADLASQKTLVTRQLTDDLAANKAALANKEAELSGLKITAPTAQSSIVGQNKMQAPQSYPFEEIKKLAASGYIGSASYNSYYREHADTIIAKATPGDKQNQYVDIPADRTRFVDPDNLTPEVQNELAQFAAHMINGVRQQLGLVPVVVTTGSQEFARLLSTSYKQTHGNVRPWFVYGQPGAAGHYGVGPHDKTLIEASAVATGLVQRDDNMYENVGAFNDVHTVNGIKRGIYDSIKYMLFTDNLHGNTYGHAVNFLRVDKHRPEAPVYLGFSTSNVESLNEHFVIFPESNIVDHNRFSKSQIAASGDTHDYSTRVATVSAGIATIKGKIASLESRLKAVDQEAEIIAAQAKIIQLQNQVEQSANRSALLNRQMTQQLSNSKGALRTKLLAAKTELEALQTKLDQSLAQLAASKVTLHHMEEAAAKASAKVADLMTKKANLEALRDFKANPNRLQLALKQIDQTKQELEATTVALANAQENLSSLQTQKASLVAAIVTAEHQLTLLRTLVQEKEDRWVEARITELTDPSRLPILDVREFLLPDQEDKTPIVKEVVKETKELLDASAKMAAESTSLVAEALVGQVSEMVATNAIVSKVTSSVTQTSIKKSYGAGSSTTSNMTSEFDESTQRALKAGVVMLAAVGLTGVKLRKDTR
ncbi:SEC10/PgrA surface exclusion domain-containing protein [Streptococcus dysgalactiae]|uniref:SEC10/PgrA surface exclusion domain-containing protein n=1 Tax=Streptococcus dysgalactiae TaxID=1334 RepID=UPI001C9DA122|nr:SEC10/PgrA surface exclusion domain-containing protein [Streptococcus dysgalactiae]QZT27004.1 SEC10/PgrA surface exclusion domain-containing protein [Streptococcus dysgalactiae]